MLGPWYEFGKSTPVMVHDCQVQVKIHHLPWGLDPEHWQSKQIQNLMAQKPDPGVPLHPVNPVNILVPRVNQKFNSPNMAQNLFLDCAWECLRQKIDMINMGDAALLEPFTDIHSMLGLVLSVPVHVHVAGKLVSTTAGPTSRPAGGSDTTSDKAWCGGVIKPGFRNWWIIFCFWIVAEKLVWQFWKIYIYII